MNKFPERFRRILKDRNILHKDFGTQIGVHGNTVTNYCSGHRQPSYDILIKICHALNEKSDYLIGVTDD